MSSPSPSAVRSPLADQDVAVVFERAAELFGLMSAPIRLRIISELCQGERNVTQLIERMDATQPNMSQHLGMLYRAGILARRREGSQVYYRVRDPRAQALCRAVCTQVAADLDAGAGAGAPVLASPNPWQEST